MNQLSAYEAALAAETNPAHVRLFLFICQRFDDKDLDAGDLMEKSDPSAGALMSMINQNSTGYTKSEVALLFDHFMKWYETPHTNYEGKTQFRQNIRFSVDYAPDSDFADILRAWHKDVKEKRGPDGPKMPRSWGVGMKCSYSCSKGHAQFESSTIDHHGKLLKVEPWEKFFQSEDPADEAFALSLQPKIPHDIELKIFYRNIARKCHLTASDAPALLASDNYYFGKYLYETEKDISPELKYQVFRADSLTEDKYLAREILRGERYAKRKDLLLAFPEQTDFSHSPADIKTYCPLLGILVGDICFCEFNVRFVLAPEQRRAFASRFVEAAAKAIVVDNRAFRSVIDLMNDIFIEVEKPDVIQLLVKQLRRAPQTDAVKEVLGNLQQTKLMKMQADWDLPLRDIQFESVGKQIVDPTVVATTSSVIAKICETMDLTIADAKTLVEMQMWGFVHYLFLTSRSIDFQLVDSVWLKAIDAKKEDLMLLIYEQGYLIVREDTYVMEFDDYEKNRNPFACMLKTFPQLILNSPRTDETLCPPKNEDQSNLGQWCMFRQAVIGALTYNVDDRRMLEYLQRCKALLEKLFPADGEIKDTFASAVRQKLGGYGRYQEELAILKANWA